MIVYFIVFNRARYNFCRFLVVCIAMAILLEMGTVVVYRHGAKVIQAKRGYQIRRSIHAERNEESMTQKNKYVVHTIKKNFF